MTDTRSTAPANRLDGAGRFRPRTAVVSTLAAGALALTWLGMPSPAAAAEPSPVPADAADADGAGQQALATIVQWPLEARDANISDGFGNRVAPCVSCSSNHRGLDFAAPMGTPVGAIADGTVIGATYVDNGGLGLHVVLEHEIEGQRVESIYAHLDYASITVQIGDQVRVGDRIGSVGNTGSSTGPHLHLETIVDDVHRDPLAVLTRYADGDDTVEVTDRPSLPWLPAGPAADAPAGDSDRAEADEVPAEQTPEPAAEAVDRAEPVVGIAVSSAPEVLLAPAPTESIVVGTVSDTAETTESAPAAPVEAPESGVAIGTSEESSETGVSLGVAAGS